MNGWDTFKKQVSHNLHSNSRVMNGAPSLAAHPNYLYLYFILYREEAQEYIEIGTLNALFVLGRSMGFIGHYLDQKRLKQGLYRHPWDDISYVMPELNNPQE